MAISGFVRFNLPISSLFFGSSIIATLAVVAVARLALLPSKEKIIRSPRQHVLSKLSKSEQDDLPYPPDSFPGARDIQSAYGSIRAYEFGPTEGRKVLLLHGISTPCVSLGTLSNALVEKGCRVILMDLFGRGYSDSPDLPYDSRLYSTQILLAITSSPLEWTPEGFTLIGYSLGGGVAADFAAHFPNLVKDLVLLAPGGLIRDHHFGWQSKLLYESFLPDWLVHTIVERRLRGPSPIQTKSDPNAQDTDAVINAEIKGNRDPRFESAVLSKTRPGVTVASALQWQVENHRGFVRSFVSSFKYAPIKGQREVWKKLRERERKVLIVAGSTDSIVVAEELREDVMDSIGKEGSDWRVFEGGHEFPITQGEEVANIINATWNCS